MSRRKITDDHLQQISDWDLQGYTLDEMAAHLPVSKETVRKNLHRIRAERREFRNESASAFLDQLDELKRQAWRATRQSVVETTEDESGVTTKTKGPPIAAITATLDILKEQARLLGLGSTNLNLKGDEALAPKVINIVVKDREELADAMTFPEFRSRLLPGPEDG